MHAMIIEKNEATRNYICNLFNYTDVETSTYHDTLYALDDLYNQRVKPYIIYLDAMENTMEALQFMELLIRHEEYRNIPVVVMMSQKASFAIESRFRENATMLIRKPLNVDSIMKALEKVYYTHAG